MSPLVAEVVSPLGSTYGPFRDIEHERKQTARYPRQVGPSDWDSWRITVSGYYGTAIAASKLRTPLESEFFMSGWKVIEGPGPHPSAWRCNLASFTRHGPLELVFDVVVVIP